MVHRMNRYFQNLKTKGIMSVFKLAKGDYSNIEYEIALWKKQAWHSAEICLISCMCII